MRLSKSRYRKGGDMGHQKASIFNKIVAILLCFSVLGYQNATAQVTSEYDVKAAFLLNFAKFVEWSELSPSLKKSLPICLWKESPFGSSIEKLVGRTVGERVISVHKVDRLSQVAECGILFISAAYSPEIETSQSIAIENHVLRVTEASLAGSINFVTQDDRVRFDCNIVEAEKSGIKLSSQLLKLAMSVKEK